MRNQLNLDIPSGDEMSNTVSNKSGYVMPTKQYNDGFLPYTEIKKQETARKKFLTTEEQNEVFEPNLTRREIEVIMHELCMWGGKDTQRFRLDSPEKYVHREEITNLAEKLNHIINT